MAEIKKLGRYELRGVLGKGAMGVVYEGFDPSIGRRVAVKTILKSFGLDAESEAAYGARFIQEAKAVGRLNHANIVQVYDFGVESDVAYLVMEFIQGRELRTHFAAGERFEPREIMRVMSELLDALHFAHEAGVIHRDIKPANIMLDAQRRVKLTDFGVARIVGNEASVANTMVGTPAFMSPEQVRGESIDRRTDIFSAGTILYQLLTGEQPFKGAGAWTVAKQIIEHDPPAPSSVTASASSALDAVVNKALAKRSGDRFQSAKSFSAALTLAFEGTAMMSDPDSTVAAPAPNIPAGPSAGAGGLPRSHEVELEFWRSIKDGNDPDDFGLYVEQFPTGIYARLARSKIAKLRGTEAPEKALDDSATRTRLTEERGAAEAREKHSKEREAFEQELARREEEVRQREAQLEAKRQAESKERAALEARHLAEDKARAAMIEKARLDAEKAKQEAVSRAKLEAEARTREITQREAEAAAAARLPPGATRKISHIVLPLVIVAVAGVSGALWFLLAPRQVEDRLAILEKQLEESRKRETEFQRAKELEAQALKALELARRDEVEAKRAGDLAKQAELAETRVRVEAEAKKLTELTKKSETDAKKSAEAVEKSKAIAEKVAAEREGADQTRLARERVALEEKTALEKTQAEKASADARAAAETAKAEQAKPPSPAISGLVAPGARWVYRFTDHWSKNTEQITHTVIAADATGITEHAQKTDRPAISTRFPHEPELHALPLVPDMIYEFAPYAMAAGRLRQGQIITNVRGKRSSAEVGNWSVSATVQAEEEISVPAGRFRATKVLVRGVGQSTAGGQTNIQSMNAMADRRIVRFEISVWYAQNVKRYIKLNYNSFSANDRAQDRATYELVSMAN